MRVFFSVECCLGGNSLFATANLSGLLLDLDSDAPGTCVLRGGLGDFSSFFRLII